MLSEMHTKRRKFLHRPGVSGNVLFQTSTDFHRIEEIDQVDVFEDDEL
jgi:hypothetical protein